MGPHAKSCKGNKQIHYLSRVGNNVARHGYDLFTRHSISDQNLICMTNIRLEKKDMENKIEKFIVTKIWESQQQALKHGFFCIFPFADKFIYLLGYKYSILERGSYAIRVITIIIQIILKVIS